MRGAVQGALDEVRADHDVHAALLAQAAGDGARLHHLLDRSRAEAQAVDHAVRVWLGVCVRLSATAVCGMRCGPRGVVCV